MMRLRSTVIAIIVIAAVRVLAGYRGTPPPSGADTLVAVPVSTNFLALLREEDTDRDRRITVGDPRLPDSVRGDRSFELIDIDGAAHPVTGTYRLSNLLQELAVARERGDSVATISFGCLGEPPADRISRLIRMRWWDNLTRRIDAEHLAQILRDEKISVGSAPYLYVPCDDTLAFSYFSAACRSVARCERCRVIRLPRVITPEYVRDLEGRHGILSLALRRGVNGAVEGVPFIVPGGRFNEMYGWDSYFEALGLLADGRVELARAMIDNFAYQIEHYSMILNANRTYYLTRSQPPFLTSMIRAVYRDMPADSENVEWLKRSLRAAIDEYHGVWMREPRLTGTGLSRYHGAGTGPCPEVEAGHYDHLYRRFADRHGIGVDEYRSLYLSGEIEEPELDAFFVHDRAMRESGHDTSYRWYLNGDRAADVVPVDLNSLLFKYEIDIAAIIEREFGGELGGENGGGETSEAWYERAARRRALMRRYLWDPRLRIFLDYDTRSGRRHDYIAAAALYPLWASDPTDPRASLLSGEEARHLVETVLPLLEMPGGIAASSRRSRGPRTAERPDRQWDYPYGWAPHQMIAWRGLRNFGFEQIRQRLIYRWLYTITRNAVDYNGTVPEKYDVVARSHRVFAEYGNVGTDFDYITREGFGWMNASYQVGLRGLDLENRRRLNELVPPEQIFHRTNRR